MQPVTWPERRYSPFEWFLPRDPVTPQELRDGAITIEPMRHLGTEAAVSLLVTLEEAAEAELGAAALGGAAELPGQRLADVREAMPSSRTTEVGLRAGPAMHILGWRPRGSVPWSHET